MATLERADILVSLTETAAAKVKELQAGEPKGEADVLRVAVQGGGCSGFEYALGFDRGVQEGDVVVEEHGVTVVVDPFSAPYLRGARDRLPQRHPGVRLQDLEPERRLVVWLRPLVPGRRGRGAARRRRDRRLRLWLLALMRKRISGGCSH